MKLNPNLSTDEQIILLSTFEIRFEGQDVVYNFDTINYGEIVNENVHFFSSIKSFIIKRLNISVKDNIFFSRLENYKKILSEFSTDNQCYNDIVKLYNLSLLEPNNRFYEDYFHDYLLINPIVEAQVKAVKEVKDCINYLLNSKIDNLIQDLEIKKTKKQSKSINDFILNVNQKEEFLIDLKNTFNTEYGKSIKILIDTLVEINVIQYGNREFKLLIECLSSKFERELGTYQSIKDYNNTLPEDKNVILEKLKPLLVKHSIN